MLVWDSINDAALFVIYKCCSVINFTDTCKLFRTVSFTGMDEVT
jgi:hypothetical protein